MPPPSFRVSLIPVFTLAGLLISGCATTNQPANGPAATIVEGETVYPTGSRISRVVKKGDAAGVAGDMPGGSTGTRNLEKEANDFRAQAPITGR
jgi:hypothetical protein